MDKIKMQILKDFTPSDLDYHNVNYSLFGMCKVLEKILNKQFSFRINTKHEYDNGNNIYYKEGFIFQIDQYGKRIKGTDEDYKIFSGIYMLFSENTKVDMQMLFSDEFYVKYNLNKNDEISNILKSYIKYIEEYCNYIKKYELDNSFYISIANEFATWYNNDKVLNRKMVNYE